MNTDRVIERRALKSILWVYIVLCFVIAGLNYGYAPHATPKVAAFITWFWHFYENWIKTFFILTAGILTLRIIGKTKRSTLRRRNLIGFFLTAMVVHILLPLITGIQELYFFTMPLPWTTTPFQLMSESSGFYLSRFPLWGLAGISAALLFYIIVSIIVFVGTLLFGRRLQCSTLCLFNGFAAEVFDPAMPLIGKARKCSPQMLTVLAVVRRVFFGVAILFSLWWNAYLTGVPTPGNPQRIGNVETYLYLIGELMMAMLFWMVFIGRGYCCPLGTLLALIGKVAGQQIVTDNTKCVECGSCNAACPMTIDLKTAAIKRESSRNSRCVGCGHCVDACPTKTLTYTTTFLTWAQTRKNKSKAVRKQTEQGTK
jgi:ferredoxin